MVLGISTALLTALALLFVPVRSTGAQAAPRVQVALVDSLSSPDARAEIVRFAGNRPDLILLRSSTVRSEDLVAAIATWESARTQRPAKPGLVARTTVVSVASKGDPDVSAVRRAQAILHQLKAAPSVRVGNLGRGRWGEFDVSR